jgi:uncharacterized protein
VAVSLDANVLLYALNADDPRHAASVRLLDELCNGHETVYLAWPVLMAFLRIATHPAIFPRPLAPAEAEERIGALLARPNVAAVAEREGFWEAYREVADEAGPVVARLVPDAHLATILKQHGIRTLYTFDRDFRRFRFLQAREPATT